MFLLKVFSPPNEQLSIVLQSPPNLGLSSTLRVEIQIRQSVFDSHCSTVSVRQSVLRSRLV